MVRLCSRPSTNPSLGKYHCSRRARAALRRRGSSPSTTATRRGRPPNSQSLSSLSSLSSVREHHKEDNSIAASTLDLTRTTSYPRPSSPPLLPPFHRTQRRLSSRSTPRPCRFRRPLTPRRQRFSASDTPSITHRRILITLLGNRSCDLVIIFILIRSTSRQRQVRNDKTFDSGFPRSQEHSTEATRAKPSTGPSR